jgi:hypothetical protein
MIGVEINTDKTKYAFMSRIEHRIKLAINCYEIVVKLRYFGLTLTNEGSMQEEIKCNLNSRNDCYHLVQNFLCSSLSSKIKIHRAIKLPVLYVYEWLSLA